jgi:hypothetical protein
MSVKRTKDNITPNNRSIQKQLDKLPRQAYDVFYDATPRKTGNARRNTKLVGNKTIVAKYPYAQRLDEGYSKQAPKGMVNPTVAFIKKRLGEIFGSNFKWRT